MPKVVVDLIDVHVGKQIKSKRIERGMTLDELAREIGISFQQLQKYEKGTNRIAASNILRTAQALDVPVSYLFEGLEEKEIKTDEMIEKSVHVMRMFENLTPSMQDIMIKMMEQTVSG